MPVARFSEMNKPDKAPALNGIHMLVMRRQIVNSEPEHMIKIGQCGRVTERYIQLGDHRNLQRGDIGPES